MKLRRARVVGCGYYQSKYKNHEGYPDPTAGIAIERVSRKSKPSANKEFKKRKRGQKEKTGTLLEKSADVREGQSIHCHE